MAADTAAILLFFSGMIAFLPNAQNPLMVDAHLLLEDHDPLLILRADNLADIAQCKDLCFLYRGVCACTLKGVEVATSTTAGETRLPRRPPGRLPKQENAYDIDWLASMWRVKPEAARVDQRKLLESTTAKLTFGWLEGATCRFEEAACNNQRRIYAVDFNTAFFGDRLAVAELVSFKSSAPAPITLSLKRRGCQSVQGADVAVNLHLKDCLQGEPCPILVANLAPPSDPVDLCKESNCRENYRGHFMEYRRVAQQEFHIDPIRRCSKDGRDYTEIDPAPLPMCEALKQIQLSPQQGRHSESSHLGVSKSIDIGLLLEQVRTVGDRIICPSVVFQR